MMKDEYFFREVESNCWDPNVRMNECGHHGVDVQVLSTVPVMFNYWAKPDDALDVSKMLNDHIAAIVAEFPKRFVGLGTIPLQKPEKAIMELQRCIHELGMTGVQIGSNINGVNLSVESLSLFLKRQRISALLFLFILGISWEKKRWKNTGFLGWWGCQQRPVGQFVL